MRHAAPTPARTRRWRGRGSIPLGVEVLVVATVVLASPIVLAHGSVRDASVTVRPASDTGAAGDGRLTLAVCERAVSALLAEDLTRVASGMPDVTASGAGEAPAPLGGPGTPATASVGAIHDELVGPATTDIINAYQHDVSLLLSAYAGRIAEACARVSTS